MCWCARPGDRIGRTDFLKAADAPSGGPTQRRSDLHGCCAVVVSSSAMGVWKPCHWISIAWML